MLLSSSRDFMVLAILFLISMYLVDNLILLSVEYIKSNKNPILPNFVTFKCLVVI